MRLRSVSIIIAVAAAIAAGNLRPVQTWQSDKASRRPSPDFGVFAQGETLTWEVSYLAFKLGTITTRCTLVDTARGKTRYKTECLIRSYAGVPFVKLRTRFQSTVDQRFACVSFGAKEHVDDTLNKYIHYTFPHGGDVVYVSERIGNDPIPENFDTLNLDGKSWQDGLSLLFYARAHAQRRFIDRVPVLIYRTKATTTINFRTGEESKEIDAVDYEIATVKLDGETGFTGIFGLTGRFEGWFTRDAASVPVYAKMHVVIGSIRLQLVSWDKPGWRPPKHV